MCGIEQRKRTASFLVKKALETALFLQIGRVFRVLLLAIMALANGRLFVVRAFSIFAFASAIFLGGTGVASAGFGITPPYVFNDRLTRGTVYEQEIKLVRSDPTDDLQAEITMSIPEIESWFSVDRGKKFIMPKGEKQVPIVVRVQVPDDAAYARHKGGIRIRTAPVVNNAPEGGGVSIALGAHIDVNIEVVDKIFDFDVRKIRLTDLEEGRRKWGLFFPGKIRFFMTVENTGNAEYGPTKVQFDIYDNQKENLLETTTNTNKIKKIAPFAIEEVLAELPTRLAAGSYIAKYTIYKGDEVAQQNEITVSINPIGAVLDYEGYGFWGLSFEDKLKVVAALGVPLLVVLIIIILLILRRRNRMQLSENESHAFRELQ